MPDTNPQDTLDTNVSELRLNRFEAAWMAHSAGDPAPDWRQHLPADDEPCRSLLIFDLLQMDIEYRIKAGLTALLAEPYFTHPRLQREDARFSAEQMVELIRWEYQHRRQIGQPARRADYQAAFPQHAEALRDLKATSRCPRCRKIIDVDEDRQTRHCPDCDGASPSINAAAPTEFDPRTYQLCEQLGRGGMGEVYRCCDPALGRDLAIKVMKDEDRGYPEAERRFLREARVTGSLQHPGIVPIHNLGRLADGRLHYTMRLVRGKTFADILKDEGGKPERLPSLLGIFEKVCQAVAYAHSKRVLHRDLKPANVMVGKFGEVQVMDWGLAKLLTPNDTSAAAEENTDAVSTRIHTESPDTPAHPTGAGAFLGTLAYMPPEQARRKWDKVDERADVFALGSILCEMLTGQPAHIRADAELLDRVERGDVTEALQRLQRCGADAPLIALCRECLSPRRDDRPRDADVLAKRMAEYQAEVQERLRRAELESVAAEARAREEQTRLAAEEARTQEVLNRLTVERRARRRLLALSGAVLITIATAFVFVRSSAEQAHDAKNQALELADKYETLANVNGDLAQKEIIAREDAQKSQQEAKKEAQKAQKVAEFLGGIFEASDPIGLTSKSIIFPRAAGEKLSAQDLLERGAEKCERELKDQPDVQAVVLGAIGNAYVNLGEYEKGKPVLEKALRLVEQRDGNPQDIATIKLALGSLYHAKGYYDTAEKLYRSALKHCEKAQPINELLVADTLFNLGWLLTEKEEHAEAEQCYQRCLALRTKNLEKNHRLVALCQAGLAAVYLDKNENYLRALPLIEQSIQTFKGNRSVSW